MTRCTTIEYEGVVFEVRGVYTLGQKPKNTNNRDNPLFSNPGYPTEVEKLDIYIHNQEVSSILSIDALVYIEKSFIEECENAD